MFQTGVIMDDRAAAAELTDSGEPGNNENYRMAIRVVDSHPLNDSYQPTPWFGKETKALDISVHSAELLALLAGGR